MYHVPHLCTLEPYFWNPSINILFSASVTKAWSDSPIAFCKGGCSPWPKRDRILPSNFWKESIWWDENIGHMFHMSENCSVVSGIKIGRKFANDGILPVIGLGHGCRSNVEARSKSFLRILEEKDENTASPAKYGSWSSHTWELFVRFRTVLDTLLWIWCHKVLSSGRWKSCF